jgi:hypothetical protein
VLLVAWDIVLLLDIVAAVVASKITKNACLFKTVFAWLFHYM